MQIRRVHVGRIDPAPYNPRLDLQPGDAEYARLERSLDEFGCVEPLVWNERTGRLVGGHQRLKILIARGDSEVDVSVVDLPEEREKALNLALNKIAGGWDNRKLAELLDELLELPDFDLELTGFEAPEARELIRSALGEEESFDLEAALADDTPSVTRPGDLIELGGPDGHRLLCGDATSAEDVRRLMDGHRAVLFATDPPYLVGYDGTNHPTGFKDWSKSYGVTWDDAKANEGLYEGFLRAAVDHAVAEDAAWYCWHASARQAMVEQAWRDAGAFVHCQIIWVKKAGVLTRTWYLWRHEPCFFGWRKGRRPRRIGQDRPSTVWEIDSIPRGSDRPDHPTPKPLEVFELPMRQHTRPGEVCYEPFAGSGTQIIAAERLARRCFAMEISPKYCDVIVRRYIAHAGAETVAPGLAERYLEGAAR